MNVKHKTIFEILGRHPIHPFPARMAPDIALAAIDKATSPLKILDPMMGSGTVLAVARSKGHYGIGIDVDPLSILLSKVWSTAIDRAAVKLRAREVLAEARVIFDRLPVRDAYPENSDDETRSFVRYWFDPYSRRQLTSLATAINRVGDHKVRDVLWCGFSRLIITKQSGASLAMDLSHSRPHRKFKKAPAKPFIKFLAAVHVVADNCLSTSERGRGREPRFEDADARRMPLRASSVDLVITSPPYLNAIDYLRCSKFSLVWMGQSISSLRKIRTESIGAERSLSSKEHEEATSAIIRSLKLNPQLKGNQAAILSHYINDMRAVVMEITRVLKPGGKAIYVIGENTLRGTYIRNARILSILANRAGLSLDERRTRTLPANRRYLPPPKEKDPAALSGRMRREVILSFTKAGSSGFLVGDAEIPR